MRQLELSTSPAHDILPEAVSAIQFATAYDIPEILPAAFYQLAVTQTKRDWRESGALASAPAPPVTNVSAARWFTLDETNAVRFAKGRDAMVEYYFAHVERDIDRPPNRFPHEPYGCRCVYTALKTEIKMQCVTRNLDCLRELQNLVDRCDHDYGLCGTCMPRIRSHFRRLRVELWDRLPQFFGVMPGANRLGWSA